MKRSAFTMLELIFVVVVAGILAATIMPRMKRDLRQEAIDDIVSAIQYTQHLALMDDKQLDDNPKWQQRFWRIVFSRCGSTGWFYMIGSDDNMEDANNAFFDKNESAVDPLTGKPLFYKCSGIEKKDVSSSIFISKKYGIEKIKTRGNCRRGRHIAFDHLGRPFHGTGFSKSAEPDSAGYMKNRCSLRLIFKDPDIKRVKIDIEPETGYVEVDKN